MFEDELLTPEEIAEMLGVHGNTVRGWIHRGLLRAYRTPTGYFFVRKRDVQKLIKEYNPYEDED